MRIFSTASLVCLAFWSMGSVQAQLKQTAYIKASNPHANDHFGNGGTLEGHGLAISGDGNTMAVGAPYESSADFANGHTQKFWKVAGVRQFAGQSVKGRSAPLPLQLSSLLEPQPGRQLPGGQGHQKIHREHH